MTRSEHEVGATRAHAWNRGGWLGSQLGSTLWLLGLGLFALPVDQLIAIVSFACFAGLNGWGSYLWRRRFWLSPYAGIQAFLAGATAVTLLVVVVTNVRSEQLAGDAALRMRMPYWVVLVAPALMLTFFLKERSLRRASGRAL